MSGNGDGRKILAAEAAKTRMTAIKVTMYGNLTSVEGRCATTVSKSADGAWLLMDSVAILVKKLTESEMNGTLEAIGVREMSGSTRTSATTTRC